MPAAPRVIVQHADFDLSDVVAQLRAGDAAVGAVAAFIGTVRDRNDGAGVSAMELEHYPGMTERAIEAMIDVAMARFELRAVRVIHRVGLLQPLDQIVLVAVSLVMGTPLVPNVISSWLNLGSLMAQPRPQSERTRRRIIFFMGVGMMITGSLRSVRRW